MRYLKYVKTAKGGKRGRLVNIFLCTMQMLSPFFTEGVLILAISQTDKLSMIIKSFVALGFVIRIDDMFSENFPEEIKNEAGAIHLVIGKDQNTLKKIISRIKKQRESNEPVLWTQAISNILVNLWYWFVNNFYIIVYYYFFPLTCLFIQFGAFYSLYTN